MYIVNLTEGSILLPNGQDLVTWLEVSKEEAEQLEKYKGTLLDITSTKPEAKNKQSLMKIEETELQGGFSTLAEARGEPEPTVETEEPVAPAPKATPKKKKE